jgi:hypothetical protein
MEFLGPVTYVDPLIRVKPLGNPEEAVKPHDMVNTEDTGVLKVMTKATDEILVAVFPDSFWV